jgi:SAM-dependent methyltransferase
MSGSKAQEIVARAMADPAVYGQMKARESEVWGKLLPARESSEKMAEDRAAAATLRVCRRSKGLCRVARERGLTFEHGLSLGCGEGRLEREVVAARVCRSFHGVDISEAALARARAEAERLSLPITYDVADLNFLDLPEARFDLVAAQTALHHVLRLEHLAEQVWRSLKPGGMFWLHDYIGESQFQYDEARVEIINRIRAVLPDRLKLNRLTGKVFGPLVRPEPGKLVSPFESIRSADIIPVLGRWFEVEWKNEFTSLLHLLVPPGTRSNFVENDDTRTVFDLLALLDDLLLDYKVLTPTGGQYVLRRRDRPHEAAGAGDGQPRRLEG